MSIGKETESGATPAASHQAVIRPGDEFRATAGGVVSEVAVAAGQAVDAGDLLVVISPEGT